MAADQAPPAYPVNPAINYPVLEPAPIPQWEGEAGARYFFSSGQSRLKLYGAPGVLNSQLTYSGLTAHAGEIFGRVEHISGFFVKGYLGGAWLNNGQLKDEDFPPAITPYSSTTSDQRGGNLKYATVDFGWDWRSENVRLGMFAGYLYYADHLNAYGCTQNAGNPFVCVPSIPNSVLAITDDVTWNAMRLGIVADWRLGFGWSLVTEAAWLPVGLLNASDFHWLRADLINPTPEKGAAFSQVQLEAILRYQFTPNFSMGVGGRYWQIGTTSGEADFVGSQAQAITYRTERWGAFVQASYTFGDLPPTRRLAP